MFWWIIITNAVTFFVTWRLMAWWASHLPEVLAQTNGKKLWEFLTEDDVEWIKEQARANPNFVTGLRRKT